LHSDDVRGVSGTVRLNIAKAVEKRRLSILKSLVDNRLDFIFDTLLNFEPTESLQEECCGRIWRFRNCLSGRVENELKTL